MIRIHYYTDSYFFSGSQNILSNFLNNQELNNNFILTISYPDTQLYQQGFKRRIPTFSDERQYPLFLPAQSRARPYLKKVHYPKPIKWLLSILIKLLQASYVFLVYDVFRNYFLLRKIKPNLLHVNNSGYPAADSCRAAVIAAKLVGIKKIVFTVNNMAAPRKVLRRFIESPIDRFMNKTVSYFVTASKFAANELVQERGFDKSKVINIPNTIVKKEVKSSKSIFRKEFGFDMDDVIFGFVGLFEERKGLKALINAINILTQRKRNLSKTFFIFKGEGELENKLRKLVSDLNLQSIILFFKADENVMDFYKMIDVFILPSIAYEDMPYVILEAMSSGKPIIGTDLAGIPEEVADGVNGYIVDKNNIEELANAITSFLNNRSLITTMGKASLTRFNELFEYNQIIGQYFSLYKFLLRK